ncbi:MAG: hypothetical protein ABWY34_11635 [Pseudoxanthomonas sp.]
MRKNLAAGGVLQQAAGMSPKTRHKRSGFIRGALIFSRAGIPGCFLRQP